MANNINFDLNVFKYHVGEYDVNMNPAGILLDLASDKYFAQPYWASENTKYTLLDLALDKNGESQATYESELGAGLVVYTTAELSKKYVLATIFTNLVDSSDAAGLSKAITVYNHGVLIPGTVVRHLGKSNGETLVLIPRGNNDSFKKECQDGVTELCILEVPAAYITEPGFSSVDRTKKTSFVLTYNKDTSSYSGNEAFPVYHRNVGKFSYVVDTESYPHKIKTDDIQLLININDNNGAKILPMYITGYDGTPYQMFEIDTIFDYEASNIVISEAWKNIILDEEFTVTLNTENLKRFNVGTIKGIAILNINTEYKLPEKNNNTITFEKDEVTKKYKIDEESTSFKYFNISSTVNPLLNIEDGTALPYKIPQIGDYSIAYKNIITQIGDYSIANPSNVGNYKTWTKTFVRTAEPESYSKVPKETIWNMSSVSSNYYVKLKNSNTYRPLLYSDFRISSITPSYRIISLFNREYYFPKNTIGYSNDSNTNEIIVSGFFITDRYLWTCVNNDLDGYIYSVTTYSRSIAEFEDTTNDEYNTPEEEGVFSIPNSLQYSEIDPVSNVLLFGINSSGEYLLAPGINWATDNTNNKLIISNKYNTNLGFDYFRIIGFDKSWGSDVTKRTIVELKIELGLFNYADTTTDAKILNNRNNAKFNTARLNKASKQIGQISDNSNTLVEDIFISSKDNHVKGIPEEEWDSEYDFGQNSERHLVLKDNTKNIKYSHEYFLEKKTLSANVNKSDPAYKYREYTKKSNSIFTFHLGPDDIPDIDLDITDKNNFDTSKEIDQYNYYISDLGDGIYCGVIGELNNEGTLDGRLYEAVVFLPQNFTIDTFKNNATDDLGIEGVEKLLYEIAKMAAIHFGYVVEPDLSEKTELSNQLNTQIAVIQDSRKKRYDTWGPLSEVNSSSEFTIDNVTELYFTNDSEEDTINLSLFLENNEFLKAFSNSITATRITFLYKKDLLDAINNLSNDDYSSVKNIIYDLIINNTLEINYLSDNKGDYASVLEYNSAMSKKLELEINNKNNFFNKTTSSNDNTVTYSNIMSAFNTAILSCLRIDLQATSKIQKANISIGPKQTYVFFPYVPFTQSLNNVTAYNNENMISLFKDSILATRTKISISGDITNLKIETIDGTTITSI